MSFRIPTLLFAVAYSAVASAQYAWQYEDVEPGKLRLQDSLHYRVEMQTTVSNHKTPLWLNANRYGLSSLDSRNGYLRASLERPLRTDSARRWGVGYGIDAAVAHHFTSRVVLQQAYVELRWLHGVLTAGEKEYPMELKNNRLSSGSQTLGINARPIPQVRVALPEYWTLPLFKRWVHLKGHIGYGIYTDDDWQRSFTRKQSLYVRHTLYHSKAGYIMIGKPEAFYPLTVEMGLEMGAQFGGTSYHINEGGKATTIGSPHRFKDFFNAFIPGGYDETDGEYPNIEGNQLGSWVARVSYEADAWKASLYADHYFEDHSQMFFLDFDGYGMGDDYQKTVKHKFFLYALKDIMLGGELNLKRGRWVRNIVVEYLYTKYQSGPINHDHTRNIPDHVAGRDDYYNHSNYTGWEHWGQVIGNPLYRSPIYNDNGVIRVENNRFVAWHLGFDGQPSQSVDYRVLASWQRGYGTYVMPYTKPRHNVSFMAEATWHLPRQWELKGAYGMDFGSILGHNAGFQLTIAKTGLLGK